ncbi:MAG: hypothetical protein ACWA5X_02830 [bacterium]
MPASLQAFEGVSVEVCYNFGCKTKESVTLNFNQMDALRGLFSRHASSAEAEREQIAAAIALLENATGFQTGTVNDHGENYPGPSEPGQMDCIDESTNTTEYLRLLESLHLLRWHKSGERVKRATFIFNDHWTATLVDTVNGGTYAVDSWFWDNGQPPEILPLQDWKRGTRAKPAGNQNAPHSLETDDEQ